MATPLLPAPKKRPEETLTKREMECVELLVEGLSYEGVGERLHISHNTVRVHLKRAYIKLGISSKFEAIAWWGSRFGSEMQILNAEAKLAAAEKTIELFGVDFQRAVEAEAGRQMRIFVGALQGRHRFPGA